MPKIYVDFHNTDASGRVRLNTTGSIEDLSRQGVILRDGLVVHLYCEDFEVIGTVQHNEQEHVWAARFDWEELKPLTSESRLEDGSA